MTTMTADGDLMNRKTRENGLFQGMGWMIGTVSLLFLISAGLELFVRQTFRQASVATILLALSLARWFYVLGSGGLIFLTVWWLLKWRSLRIQRAVMREQPPAEPSLRPVENPVLADPQFLGRRSHCEL
jgi:hypothetical protein